VEYDILGIKITQISHSIHVINIYYVEEAELQPKYKKRVLFTVEEVQIIRDNYNTMSVKAIAAMMQGNRVL
jgi:hypothetical protein